MEQVASRVSSPHIGPSMRWFTQWIGASSPRDPQTRLQLALLLSLVAHAAVLSLVGIAPPSRIDPADLPPLMVDLVNARTAQAPKKPDILAQSNLDGGGNTAAERQAKSPLPVLKQPQPKPDVAVAVPRPEPQPKPDVAVAAPRPRPEPDAAVAAPRHRPKPRPKQPPPAITQSHEPAPSRPQAEPQPPAPPIETPPEPAPPRAIDILNASREMLQLEARVSRSMESYQQRPRRTFIGARAREFRFARYIEDWRSKIERIGELNYPPAAHGIYGSMLVSVEIRADGSLERVEISRSSGKKVLDEAALRIVRLAAPFAPFPPDIARDTDVLSITRTWSFTLADQFQAE
jgi:protein TonB